MRRSEGTSTLRGSSRPSEAFYEEIPEPEQIQVRQQIEL